MNNYHVPVLLNETIEYLNVTKGGLYVDCTIGGGGHTLEILKRGGKVLGIDEDDEAIEHVSQNFANQIRNSELFIAKGNFAHLKEISHRFGFSKINGILFDLGISTHQLETDYRGFSFHYNSKLDMRKSINDQKVTAADLITVATEKELSRIIWQFGQDHFARKIAKAIVLARQTQTISTTQQLADIVLSARPKTRWDRSHPATRTFQALRIAVNDELQSLSSALPQTTELLIDGGRLIVISFHSLEDRIVKNFFKTNSESFESLTKKPITPTQQEINLNPRARSGKLRAGQRILN